MSHGPTVLALPDGQEVDRTVRDVLRHPDFAAAEPTWIERLRQDVQQWIFERLADLFSSGAGTVLGWVLFGVAIAVGVLVLVLATRGFRAGSRGESEPAAVVVTRRRPADWLADARGAEAAGELAEAVRCGYRAVVAALGRRGDLEEVPGRTVGEYRAQVHRSGSESEGDFGRASEVFERVWYAQRPASGDDVRTVLSVATALAGRA